MPPMRFEPNIPVFKQTKAFCALDCSAIVIGISARLIVNLQEKNIIANPVQNSAQHPLYDLTPEQQQPWKLQFLLQISSYHFQINLIKTNFKGEIAFCPLRKLEAT
jgi:hypothetical protein